MFNYRNYFMKKLFIYIFLVGLFAIGLSAQAHVMGGTAEDIAYTIEEEAEGKAVWDKLQDKQVSCKDLNDDDFDVLGDFFMGNMAGSNHTSMNEMMAQRLGEDGEKQMHVAMGKRLSGCDIAAALPQGSGYFTPMMGMGNMMGGSSDSSWGGTSRGIMGYGSGTMMGGSFGAVGILIWLASLIFLVLGSVFFWRGIQKKD
jgi:hypothetical protein